MLCPNCRRIVDRDGASCSSCGAVLDDDSTRLELLVGNGTRVPLGADVTIGRAVGNTLRLDDPAVSRHHARISVGRGGPVLQDVGSRYGTWLDGARLNGAKRAVHDGSRIRVGDHELAVQRRRTSADAGRTVVVPVGASSVMRAAEAADGLDDERLRPRLRSGYALKRLEASEGRDRWVLRDLRTDKFLRMSDDDAQLLELLDGRRTVLELVQAAERRGGTSAAGRLARLLSELEDRGLLAGAGAGAPEQADAAPAELPLAWRSRWLRTRQTSWSGAADTVERLYRRGGWLLFTRPAVLTCAALAVIGIGVFCALVAGRYGTPFVVASKIGPGGVVFLLGRFALVAVHELAHGLALCAVGRRVRAVGLKLLLVFPYAYVDTSEAWLEPRRRRIVVSAAGPASDLTLGAAFSITCLYLPAGTVRDIFFQLALAAYIGALFNLNPFIERDGYQILVDVLGVPGLRRRAREQLSRRLRGGSQAADSRVLTRYALYGLAWSVVAASFAAGMSLRYRSALEQILPGPVVWAMLATLWLALLTPAFMTFAAPVSARLRGRLSRTPA